MQTQHHVGFAHEAIRNAARKAQAAQPQIVQCQWCGVLMTGPLAGFYPAMDNGLIAILGGEHITQDECGNCPPCQPDWLK